MPSRAEALVTEFLQTHTDFTNLVRAISPEAWLKVPANELRPVAVVAYHTAEGYTITFGLGQAIAAGQPLPQFTAETMHALNAQQAAEHANPSKEDVLRILEANAAVVAAGLHAMTGEQLSAVRDFFGRRISVEEGIAYLILHHIREHAESIRSVVQAEVPSAQATVLA